MLKSRSLASIALCLVAGCYESTPERLESSTRPRNPQPSPERMPVPQRADQPVPQRADQPVPQRPNGSPPDALGSVHWILTGDLVNARDLGGTPTEDGSAVAYDALFRGPPLAALSAGGCNTFGELGIRTVIDLRIESERRAKRTSSCIGEAAEIVHAPLPVPYNLSAEDYVAILNASDSIASIFERLADDSAYPIYLHCTYGRDRTGVVAAVILRALGVSRDAIVQEYLLSQPSVGAYPGSLEAALDSIEAAGGIDAYLTAAGVTSEQRARLRDRVLSAEE